MKCVCGHPAEDHHTVAMSVPLTAKPALYPLPAGPYNNIASVHPTANLRPTAMLVRLLPNG